MEHAVITDRRGFSKVVNPSDRTALSLALSNLTKNWGLIQDIADWCDIASAGMTYPDSPSFEVKIVAH